MSPVIATVLLVLVALILASIIFVWAKSFIGEKAQKSGEPLENSCGRISFEAEAISADSKIYITNRGNVPIYGMEIRKKGLGSEVNIGLFTQTINNGENGEIDLSQQGITIEVGDELIIVPIVLGESGSDTKAYTCDVSESETIMVE